MTTTPRFELVSFDLCPYVQRSVITLKHKKVDFKLTLINLSEPPEWFNEISPLGKVPLLLVHDATGGEPVVLFESAVINEYVDEVTPPRLAPQDPLQKARERAWIVVGGELLSFLYSAMTADDPAAAAESMNELWETLERVEAVLPGGSYFSRRGFSLVDAAFAPAFMRILMKKSLRDDPRWKKLPKTLAWAQALLALPEVQTSVPVDFKARSVEMLRRMGSPEAAQDII